MIEFCFESYFFLLATNLSLKVQARMEDKVRIKNLKSLFAFFEKFSRVIYTCSRRKVETLHLDPRNERGSFVPPHKLQAYNFIVCLLPCLLKPDGHYIMSEEGKRCDPPKPGQPLKRFGCNGAID